MHLMMTVIPVTAKPSLKNQFSPVETWLFCHLDKDMLLSVRDNICLYGFRLSPGGKMLNYRFTTQHTQETNIDTYHQFFLLIWSLICPMDCRIIFKFTKILGNFTFYHFTCMVVFFVVKLLRFIKISSKPILSLEVVFLRISYIYYSIMTSSAFSATS